MSNWNAATPIASAPRIARKGLGLLVLVSSLALAGAIGCDDPMAHLEEARQALDEGKRRMAAGADSFADDPDGRAASKGLSLGPEHAKRLYYQFVDARGQVRFVERMDDVPAEWRSRVGFVEMDSPPPLSPSMAQNTRTERFQEVAHKYKDIMPKKSARIVLYSAEWCGWCKKAKRHLDGKGVDYELRDIDQPKYLSELVAKTGQKGIPVLDVGGKVVTGFSPERYDELIRKS